jgi:hypothetical protein
VRKLVADDVDDSSAASSSSSSSSAARRIKYGRQDYHIFVKRGSSSGNATRDRCAALFDIAPARLKLLGAGGRALTTEAEVGLSLTPECQIAYMDHYTGCHHWLSSTGCVF